MFLFELSNKIDAKVDAMGFKIEKIKPATVIRRVQLPGKVDKLRKCSADLKTPMVRQPCLLLEVWDFLQGPWIAGEPVAVRGTRDSHEQLTSTATWLTTPV